VTERHLADICADLNHNLRTIGSTPRPNVRWFGYQASWRPGFYNTHPPIHDGTLLDRDAFSWGADSPAARTLKGYSAEHDVKILWFGGDRQSIKKPATPTKEALDGSALLFVPVSLPLFSFLSRFPSYPNTLSSLPPSTSRPYPFALPCLSHSPLLLLPYCYFAHHPTNLASLSSLPFFHPSCPPFYSALLRYLPHPLSQLFGGRLGHDETGSSGRRVGRCVSAPSRPVPERITVSPCSKVVGSRRQPGWAGPSFACFISAVFGWGFGFYAMASNLVRAARRRKAGRKPD